MSGRLKPLLSIYFLVLARMFDYIDTGMMEGVQHRLLSFTEQQMQNVSNVQEEHQLSAGNHVALRSKVSMPVSFLLACSGNRLILPGIQAPRSPHSISSCKQILYCDVTEMNKELLFFCAQKICLIVSLGHR